MSPDFTGLITALQDLDRQAKGIGNEPVEIQSMEELEREYIEFSKKAKHLKFNFGSWIPSLREHMRSLVPGELATILADTGVGKTSLLHNIALHAAPLKTVLFEIELPATQTFERFVSLQTKTSSEVVEAYYENGKKVEWKRSSLSHIFTCSRSKLHVEDIERIINSAESKIGERPALVLIDYIGLVQARGTSRYERMSNVAENLKNIAKSTNTIIIAASQVHRKADDDSAEIDLHDAKDSGSIENSSGVVLGVWREGEGGKTMIISVVKQTKKKAKFKVYCQFDGTTYTISEIPKPSSNATR